MEEDMATFSKQLKDEIKQLKTDLQTEKESHRETKS